MQTPDTTQYYQDDNTFHEIYLYLYVWYGMVWYGMYGMYGMVWYGMVW